MDSNLTVEEIAELVSVELRKSLESKFDPEEAIKRLIDTTVKSAAENGYEITKVTIEGTTVHFDVKVKLAEIAEIKVYGP